MATKTVNGLRHPLIGGVAEVIDGDTIEVSDVRIRLPGVDAPELRHHGGQAARAAMIEIVRGSDVSCQPDGSTTRGRIVAKCFRESDGRDIAAELIRRGFALDCAHFSSGEYAFFETAQAQHELTRASYCKR